MRQHASSFAATCNHRGSHQCQPISTRRAVLVKAGHLRAMTFKGGRTLIEVASVRELMRNNITSRPNS
jgi:hypothetical protein